MTTASIISSPRWFRSVCSIGVRQRSPIDQTPLASRRRRWALGGLLTAGRRLSLVASLLLLRSLVSPSSPGERSSTHGRTPYWPPGDRRHVAAFGRGEGDVPMPGIL